MAITKIFSFLAVPDKAGETEVHGTEITGTGRLLEMLTDLYDRSDRDCRIPIRFIMSDEGEQINIRRDTIIDMINNEDYESGRVLAKALQDVTTHRSGMGLFFIITGKESNRNKILLSRFPADNGIMAESRQDGRIDVKFIERVFMKNAKSYKAVVYEGSSVDSHFWDGFATDKQINVGIRTISDYWVKDFLKSDFLINSALGSKRLAETLMKAIKDAPDLDVKHELVSSVVLIRNLNRQNISIKTFGERLTLSPEARGALRKTVRNRAMWEETFRLDIEEFRKNAPYKTIILDNGSTLSAPSHKFDEVFTVREGENNYSYSTAGKVVDEKIRRRT